MIRDKVPLKDRMMFQMGLSEFKVIQLMNSSNIELQVFEGPQRNQTVVVDSSGFSIGRDPANNYFVSEDTQMSNFHAKITYDESANNGRGQYYLEDVGSTNRTWLRLSAEGQMSVKYKLVVCDIIKIGSTVFLTQ